VPGADEKIAFDRFHVMRHVVDAVDTVSKHEHKALLREGDPTSSKSKYLWLRSAENMHEKSREHFDTLEDAHLKTLRDRSSPRRARRQRPGGRAGTPNGAARGVTTQRGGSAHACRILLPPCRSGHPSASRSC
jgi:hypothetical protein